MIAPPPSSRIASRLLPPLAGLSATLTLGIFDGAVPGVWQSLSPSVFMPLFGLALSGCAGLIAYELAQRTALPAQTPALAALPASLIGASLPGTGFLALLAILCLSSLVALRSNRHRSLGFAGQCASALGLAATSFDNAVMGSLSGAAMLLLAWALMRRSGAQPANDNREVERPSDFLWRPVERAPAIRPRLSPTASGK